MNCVQDYVDGHDLQKRDAAYVMDEFEDEIQRMHGRCIDIGCGPAIVTRELLMPRLPVDCHVVGTDKSAKMIEAARMRNAEEERLSFAELNIETERLPSDQIGAYDNLVSFNCMHWCRDMGRASENIYELLKPGGRALVLFTATHSIFDEYLKMAEYPEYESYMEDVMDFIPFFQQIENPRAEMKKILDDSGFKVLHCSLRERAFICKNELIGFKHIKAVNPFMPRMPEDVCKQYVSDMLREAKSRKFSLVQKDSNSEEVCSFLDVYRILVCYFEKPL